MSKVINKGNSNIIDIIILLILCIGFFWRPIFVNSDIFNYFRDGTLLIFLLISVFSYLFIKIAFKIGRSGSLLSTVIFVYGGPLLRISLLDHSAIVIKKGWLFGVFIGILPILLLLQALINSKNHRLVIFLFCVFLFSLIGLLNVGLLFYLNFLTIFALAILIGLGMESFSKSFKKNEKKMFRLYVKTLNTAFSFFTIIVIPVLYGLLLSFYGTVAEFTFNETISNIGFMYIFFLIAVIIFNLRLIKNGQNLVGLVLFLSILEIFSYWGMFYLKQ